MEDILDEKELLHFSLCDPLHLVGADPSRFVATKNLAPYRKGVEVLVYYITQKPVHTRNGQLMYIAILIDLGWRLGR